MNRAREGRCTRDIMLGRVVVNDNLLGIYHCTICDPLSSNLQYKTQQRIPCMMMILDGRTADMDSYSPQGH